ncbi:Uncharacterised protein [Vibrio cholerae]|nr:Uncharacterised protein [Vibrio cholerae]
MRSVFPGSAHHKDMPRYQTDRYSLIAASGLQFLDIRKNGEIILSLLH